MSWNMLEATSPADLERAQGQDEPDETWRNDDEETARPSQFDMVAFANDLLKGMPELNRQLRRLYADKEPPRKPMQKELGERNEEVA